MPTGYTNIITKDNLPPFRDFALRCARAFVGLISMRDEPLDTPIPETIEEGPSYYQDSIERSREMISKLQALSDQEYDQQEEESVEKQRDFHESTRAESRALRANYERMREQVLAWRCPELLDSVKKFMLEQLDQSIEFDCYELDLQVHKISREDRIQQLQRSIERDEIERKKELTRNRERNEWLKALRESLKE